MRRSVSAVVQNLREVACFVPAARLLRVLPVRYWQTVLPLLRSVWGNRGYTPGLQYANAVLDYALRERGPILECGSGLTTFLLSLTGVHSVCSLEHMVESWARIRARLWLAGTSADVFFTPLKSYGSFEWYDVPTALPREFRLVVCDGPPGDTLGGRYGLLPLLGERLPKGAVILLDDAERLEATCPPALGDRGGLDIHDHGQHPRGLCRCDDLEC